MKRILYFLSVFILCCSMVGCSNNSSDLKQEDFITETEADITLSEEYHLLSQKYSSLYKRLQFDIYIPTEMKIYDSGEQSGTIILSDHAAKNFLMMESRTKSDYDIVYDEYLNAVTCDIADRSRIKTYDDFMITVHNDGIPMELRAKRFDIQLDDTQKDTSSGKEIWHMIGEKCISYWFINFDEVKHDYTIAIPRMTFMIMTESFVPKESMDFTSVDIMQNILTTIDVTNLMKNAT